MTKARAKIGVAGILCWLAGAAFAPAAERFDYDQLCARAKAIAAQPYAPSAGKIPETLQRLTYDEYRRIRFNDAATWWRADRLPFQLQFFPLGFYYHEPVVINELHDGQAAPIPYSSKLFDYDGMPIGPLPSSLGFAGFRILHPLNKASDEIGAFLGASYFRMLCAQAHYGLSARGLAVNTAEPDGEEFPRFDEFWVERPKPGARELTVYALMTSRSVTGAYRFAITPGAQTVVDVKATLFCRSNPKVFGVAPLTSMFWYGENTPRPESDFRPEVHDSDGLMLHLGTGEWLWRPLVNPKSVQVASFAADKVRGFGLMQRDRRFESYEDLEAFYQLRPSVWVEPVGDWGPGAVRLVEIPTTREIDDNIVAFWVPDRLPKAGEPVAFEYRLHWALDQIAPPAGAVMATRLAAVQDEPAQRRFLIDFAGPQLAGLPEDAELTVVTTVGAGGKQVFPATVQRNRFNGSWRVSFVVAPDGGGGPVELRCYLQKGEQVLTETWSYLWSR